MIPSVVQAYANADYTIIVHFDDGKVVRYDVKPLLKKGSVFEVLLDKDYFVKNITSLHGTVAWSETFRDDDCIDLDPIVIYEHGEDITDLAP